MRAALCRFSGGYFHAHPLLPHHPHPCLRVPPRPLWSSSPSSSFACGNILHQKWQPRLATCCHILPFLPPRTRPVALSLPTNPLEFSDHVASIADHKTKSGKNGNIELRPYSETVMMCPTFRSLSPRLCRVSRRTVAVRWRPARAAAPGSPVPSAVGRGRAGRQSG